MLDDLVRQIVAFRDERDWKQFHSPKNLAASICIEAAELLECFQWSSDATLENDVRERRQEVEDEIADVLIYTLLLAHDVDTDIGVIVRRKLLVNEQRYPVEEAQVNNRSVRHASDPVDVGSDWLP